MFLMRWISARTCISSFVFIIALGWTLAASAQSPEGTGSAASDAPLEVGLHIGSLLPNQIHGVREIMGLGGARVGLRMAPNTFFETGLISGNGEGVEWKNAHADFRMDIPVQNLVAIAYVGGDANYYKPVRSSTNKLIFGGHAGGGIAAKMGSSTWFRLDMKFNISPGTSLYIGAGLVFGFGSGGTN